MKTRCYSNLKMLGKGMGVITAAFLLMMGTAASGAFAAGLNGDASYTAGPQVCGQCHEEEYDNWLSHGHSRKLGAGEKLNSLLKGKYGLPNVDARAAGFILPDHDTDLYNWDNILFVVGASKHWKTRYVDLNGYFITKGGKNQYNWENGTFVDYHADEENRPFDCGSCHTTGYQADGTAFANAVPGIVGDFAHFNITCEACHGPGQAHVVSAGDTSKIDTDTTAALCGECHTRGSDPNVILASGGFIKHHEQYPEFLNSPHSIFSCQTCHDPHVSRAKGIGTGQAQVKLLTGAKEICNTCHATQVTEYEGSEMQLAGVKCQDCHMGKATKSAVANGPYEGDDWTHLFRIDSSADYTMFSNDSTTAKDALSLEYACFRCHADADKSTLAAIGTTGTDYHTIGKTL